jgi:anti-anti-sigma factor
MSNWTWTKQETMLIVKVPGRLDAVTSPQLEQDLNVRIEQGDEHVIMDLADLDYISSAGLRIVLSTAKKLQSKGGSFVLCNLRKMVVDVFNLSGFSSFLSITDSLEDALARSRG